MAIDLLCSKIDSTYNSVSTCDPTNAGVETMYIINKQFVTGLTLSANVITALSMSGANTFQEIAPYVETMEADFFGTKTETGGDNFLHNVKFRMNGVNTTSIQLGYKIHKSQSVIIVKMSSGKYFFYGATSTTPHLDKGMISKKLDGKNGIKAEDPNGVEMELEYKGSKPPYEISSSIIAALVTAA